MTRIRYFIAGTLFGWWLRFYWSDFLKWYEWQKMLTEMGRAARALKESDRSTPTDSV